MKKIAVRLVCFTLLFCVFFLGVQEMMRYKFDQDEDMAKRYRQYQAFPEESVDVVFIGSSSTYAAIAPDIIWKECGVTSFNLGITSTSALISYYQLRFVLETQKPRLVVMDFTRLCNGVTADGAAIWESSHRKTVDSLPNWKLKIELIRQIGEDNPNQDMKTYYLPLLQYHSRWDELTEADFAAPAYRAYMNGALFNMDVTDWPISYDPLLFEEDLEEPPVSEYSWGYYQKIIELCAQYDVPLCVVNFPEQTSELVVSEYKTLAGVCAENDLPYYNLNTPDFWEALAISAATDFYTADHVNANGAVKISRAIGKILQEDYALPDHRGDPAYSQWDEDWIKFYEDYEELLAGFGY